MKFLLPFVALVIAIFSGLGSFAAQFVNPVQVAHFQALLHSFGL